MTWAAPWKSTKIKKCSEFIANCEQPETDGCCAVIPCSLCLEFNPYTGPTVYGSAEFNGTAWTGEIAGIAFVGYWQRDLYGECAFYVTLSGEIVYTLSCYEGADCKDPGDSAEVTIGYDTGTLTWTKVLHRPLALVTDYETNCKRHFCGECDCSCLTLCATLTTPYCCTVKFQLTDTAYECDGPVWSGSGTCDGDLYVVELYLENTDGSYSGCSLSGTVNGEAVTVELGGCTGWTVTFTLDDGTTLQVVCDACGCVDDEACGTGCCWPTVTTPEYPCGYLVPIDFEVSAPGCGEPDGVTGAFGASGVPNQGYCGPCNASPPVFIGSILGTRYTPGPGSYCFDTPCSIPVVLILECRDGGTTGGMDDCCGGFRLWVGTTERFAGYNGDVPPGGSADVYWMEFSPSSCSCNPLAMIFDVTFTPDCPETFPDPGPCAGLSKECCVPVCSGFTVTI